MSGSLLATSSNAKTAAWVYSIASALLWAGVIVLLVSLAKLYTKLALKRGRTTPEKLAREREINARALDALKKERRSKWVLILALGVLAGGAALLPFFFFTSIGRTLSAQSILLEFLSSALPVAALLLRVRWVKTGLGRGIHIGYSIFESALHWIFCFWGAKSEPRVLPLLLILIFY